MMTERARPVERVGELLVSLRLTSHANAASD